MNEVAAMILSLGSPRLRSGEAGNKPVVPQARLAVSGSDQPQTVLASAIQNNRATYIPARSGETRKTLANNSKARDLLGWKPAVSLEEGLDMLK